MKENIVIKDDEISIKELVFKFKNWIKYLTSKWKTIFSMCIIWGIVGLGYAIIKKPVYIASLTFALEDSKGSGGLSSYSGIASQFGLDVGGGGGGVFSGENLIELMKSRSMIEKTLLTTVNIGSKNETLAELYINFNNLRENWSKHAELSKVEYLPGCNPAKFSLKQDSLLSVFYKTLINTNLTVDKGEKNLSMIIVMVTSNNELFSKYFAEALVSNVSDFYIETKTKKASENVSILQHQTDSVRQQLNYAISGVATSVDINPNANPNREILRAPAQHRQVDVQVNTAILAELVKNLEVAKVSLRNETPLIQIIDKPILPLDVDRVSKSKSILIGSIIGFLITVFGLSFKKVFQSVLN